MARFGPACQAALSLLVLFTGMPAAYAQRNVNVSGIQQYTANCSGCHGSDAKGGDKAVSVATTLSLMTLSDTALVKILHDGTAEGMPPFAQIGDENLAAIVSYLRTLEAVSPPANAEHTIMGPNVAAFTSRIDVKQSKLLQ